MFKNAANSAFSSFATIFYCETELRFSEFGTHAPNSHLRRSRNSIFYCRVASALQMWTGHYALHNASF